MKHIMPFIILFSLLFSNQVEVGISSIEKINKNIKLRDVEKSLKLRDFSDKNRKESPLLFVKGAVLVDTTKLTINQMKLQLVSLVNKELIKKYGNI